MPARACVSLVREGINPSPTFFYKIVLWDVVSPTPRTAWKPSLQHIVQNICALLVFNETRRAKHAAEPQSMRNSLTPRFRGTLSQGERG